MIETQTRWKTLAVMAALCCLAVPAQAQVIGQPQNITVIDSGTACVTALAACATYPIDSQTGGITLSVSGTWTGTLTFEGSNNGGAFVSLMATNVASAAQATTTTASGLFTIANVGFTVVRVRATAAVTGTAIVSAAKGLGFARLGPSTVSLANLTTTSTDGMSVVNPTAATAGSTVQMSPRFKWCGTAWNSTSTLSETDCMFAEVLPATVAGTTTQTWKLGSIINGTAATYPLTIDSNGALTVLAAMTAGSFATAGTLRVGATQNISFNGRGVFTSPSDGQLDFTNNAGTIGSMVKVDALPTVSACGAGSPAVVAGSTPLNGAVTIGTTSVATCTITFNGTAFPSAPHCSGSVETTTAANARAMGYLANTTTLTIVPSAAWADSSVVNWTCISSK